MSDASEEIRIGEPRVRNSIRVMLRSLHVPRSSLDLPPAFDHHDDESSVIKSNN